LRNFNDVLKTLEHDVNAAYSALVKKIIDVMTKDIITEKDFSELQRQLHIIYNDEYLSEFRKKILSANTKNEIIELFLYNRDLCNWFNIGLVTRLVFFNAEIMQLLQAYKDYLHPKKFIDVIAFFKEEYIKTEKHFKDAKIKVCNKYEDYTVEKLIKYLNDIAKFSELKMDELLLKKISDGCFFIECTIPVKFAQQAHASINNVSIVLRKYHIEHVSIQGYPEIFALNLDKITADTSDTPPKCKNFICYYVHYSGSWVYSIVWTV